jgi:glycosyltransferase involved in cell wall biosynthesis
MPASPPRTGPTLAFFTGGDRFEDWFDKVGISLETFRNELTGGWLFNYVQALQLAGVRTVMFFASARVDAPKRFTHAPTGTPVCVMPSPWGHRKLRAAQHRFQLTSKALSSVGSYLATPIGPLIRELRRECCDAILCQEYENPRFDLCVVLGRILRLSVFATYQGSRQTFSWAERPFRRFSLRRCSGLIVPAETEIRRVRETYGVDAARIAHIPNPMDVTTWRPMDRTEARQQLGIHPRTRVVVWHGHAQIWRKGLDVLLDAWELIRNQRPRWRALLMLVGTSRNTSELSRRVEGDPTIRWIDRYVLDRQELWKYLSAADVYSLPSRHEGFAVAPVEAMACGLPIVATDASGVPDLLGSGEEGGGLIVPREDSEALASALLRVLDDLSWARQLGARARRRAEREFSLEVVGSRLRQFLFPDRTLGGTANSKPAPQTRTYPGSA